MTAPRGSTLRRRRLGHELRRLRETAQRTHVDLATLLDCSQAKVSKIESGQLGMRTVELRAVLEYLDVPTEEWEPLLTLAKESNQRGLWRKNDDVVTTKFATYVALEAEAVDIRMYQTEVVPGLLQTEEYARTVNQATRWREGIDLDRDTEVRMERQGRVLTGELKLWVILNEAAIRRVVGGEQVMRGQLQHLLELGHQPHITLQVLPFSSGAHPAMTGPFEIARFADRKLDPDVVYLENQTGGLFMEDPAESSRYNLTFESLIGHAYDPGRSAKLIGRVIDELPGEPVPY